MFTFRLIGAVALTAGIATSQLNAFVFYPQDPERQTVTCTSYVGRPDGTNQAEALMEVSTEHFRGVGDSSGPDGVYLFGVYHWIADEKLSTSETYDLVVRTANPTGPGPDMSAGGQSLRISGLSTPPSLSPSRGTWITYDGFGLGTPLWMMSWFGGSGPLEGRYYVGVDLPNSPSWPATDGHALFRADLLSANTPATLGENERLGAPDPTWGGSAGGAPYSTPWTYILGPMVASPNLHVGGIDQLSSRLGAPGANLGMNGLYPDIMGNPRCDGLMFRVTDAIAPDGLVLMGAQYAWQPPYNHAPLYSVLYGHTFIGLGSVPIPLGATMLTNGEVDVAVALPNTIPIAMSGMDMILQSVVWDVPANLAQWTNAQAVHM